VVEAGFAGIKKALESTLEKDELAEKPKVLPPGVELLSSDEAQDEQSVPNEISECAQPIVPKIKDEDASPARSCNTHRPSNGKQAKRQKNKRKGKRRHKNK
jgi:hypothetical protein